MAESVERPTPDGYVRQDVFDARMDRMEALLEKTLIEIKSEIATFKSGVREDIATFKSEMKEENAALRAEMKKDVGRLETKIEVLTARVDTLQNWQYWQIAWFAILIASVVFVPSLLRYLERKADSAVTRARILMGGPPDRDMRR
ncbi:MAG: hypothetical protein IJR14_01430 [Synergistaceae bacterium]|nr:hypothetical protein [Synergistaceae bacterium]